MLFKFNANNSEPYMKRLLIACAFLPSLLMAQNKIEYSHFNFAGDHNAGTVSANFSFKPPVFSNDKLSILVGLSLAFAEDESKFGNPAVGLKYSGLPLHGTASGLLYIPSSTDNVATLSAFAGSQDTKFGHYVPEATPVELGLSSWASLPLGLRGDFAFSYLLLFVNDKQILTEDRFELFVPYSARVSKQADQLEFGASWTGIWYATESFQDKIASQARFDAGVWLGRFKPTLEAAFPLSNELSEVLNRTLTFKLVVR